MTDPTIETARSLLADASPELRRAVGELVNHVAHIWEERTVRTEHGTEAEFDAYKALCVESSLFARELIEGGEQ